VLKGVRKMKTAHIWGFLSGERLRGFDTTHIVVFYIVLCGWCIMGYLVYTHTGGVYCKNWTG